MYNVLLVDDEPDVTKTNQKYLTRRGYNVKTADCAENTKAALRVNNFDCIVLDILLPDITGFDLCEFVRGVTDAPIIFLSCKTEEDDIITGLMTGGDDYITKPFSMRELEARIYAQVRRYKSKDFIIDRDRRIITGLGGSVSLSQLEFDLFALLYDSAPKVYPPSDIYALLWDNSKPYDSNDVAVYVRRLRRKLEFLRSLIGEIETVYGEGYRFLRKHGS